MGTDSEVPWFLIPEKEETAIVKQIVDKMERETLECTQQPLETTIHGQTIKVSSEIKHTQFDRSLIEKISGLGGALCTMVIVVIRVPECICRACLRARADSAIKPVGF